MAVEGLPDGLGEEWERKQAVKDVSRLFSEQLKGDLASVPMNNNNGNKYYC